MFALEAAWRFFCIDSLWYCIPIIFAALFVLHSCLFHCHCSILHITAMKGLCFQSWCLLFNVCFKIFIFVFIWEGFQFAFFLLLYNRCKSYIQVPHTSCTQHSDRKIHDQSIKQVATCSYPGMCIMRENTQKQTNKRTN